MSPAVSEYCDVCKTATKRCEYYPAGRSRKHGMCLECDARNPRNPVGYRSADPRYCIECDRNYRIAQTTMGEKAGSNRL